MSIVFIFVIFDIVCIEMPNGHDAVYTCFRSQPNFTISDVCVQIHVLAIKHLTEIIQIIGLVII